MGLDIAGIGSVAELAKGVMDKFWPDSIDPEAKLNAQLAVQQMVETREVQVVNAQKSIMVAEMDQKDKFTKRARPGIVWAGLLFIFLVHVAFPIIAWSFSKELPKLELPEQFWWAWSGVCSIWVIGRTTEKNGVTGKISSMITGNK